MMAKEKGDDHGQDHLEAQVITPSGIFPDDEKWRRVKASDLVSDLLDRAAQKLKLTNVSDWVAFVDDRQINPAQTFEQNGLSGQVEIEWHKPEGGGGARGLG
jgi:hypothetical protein